MAAGSERADEECSVLEPNSFSAVLVSAQRDDALGLWVSETTCVEVSLVVKRGVYPGRQTSRVAPCASRRELPSPASWGKVRQDMLGLWKNRAELERTFLGSNFRRGCVKARGN